MNSDTGDKIKYCIFDPTGNITALVESNVEIADQPAAAAEIMKKHPEVEQVGFVQLRGSDDCDGPDVLLRMAGGEFCGNATMCAAALYVIRQNGEGRSSVRVKVSGATEPLDVKLERKDSSAFYAGVKMPPAVSIDTISLSMENDPSGESLAELPLVRMEGIDHIVIESGSFFYRLLDDKKLAETFIRKWCGLLSSDCLGMMFLNEGSESTNEPDKDTEKKTGKKIEERTMIPLVYVPGADTIFWENSCASGSAAVGMYLASKSNCPVDITLSEPAGKLRVESDAASAETWLYGSTVLL